MKQTFHIRPTDKTFAAEVRTALDNLNKPKGSLGRLEELALQIALVQHTLSPALRHPCHLLFAGDHGVEREGVSASPREVTWQQVLNFCRGGGGVNLFCRQHGFQLRIVDVGVDHDFDAQEIQQILANPQRNTPRQVQFLDRKIAHGTRDFLHESAMTEDEFDRAIAVGAEMAGACAAEGCNVIALGEMGVANTSPSSVWMYFFAQLPLECCIGAGSGLGDAGMRHKFEVLRQSVTRFMQQTGIESPTPFRVPDGWTFTPGPRERPYFPEYAETILRWFGGYEMVAAVGAMLQAAALGMTILVDGFIMSACILAAAQLHPAVLDYAVFTHEGDEAGHHLMLQALGVRPLLSLGLRLGEGTGALCAFPLVDSATRMLTEMDNFQHAHITKYF